MGRYQALHYSLKETYNFYDMTILRTPCILLEMLNAQLSLDVLKKHVRRVEELTNRQVVIYLKQVSRYRRRTLIENRIPFVIDEGQMFLPFLGLDLKHIPQEVDHAVQTFTTAAQITYIYFLYHKDMIMNATEFAVKMGCSKMTASRALNELYAANLITYDIGGKTGRSKDYKRIEDPHFFLKGRSYIKSPIKKIVYTVTEPRNVLYAGLDALADISMLNPPDHPVRAIGLDQFRRDKVETVQNKDIIKDAKMVELQVWDFDPKLFSDETHVDLLSLYASFAEESDERVEQALSEVLRGEPWYSDWK